MRKAILLPLLLASLPCVAAWRSQEGDRSKDGSTVKSDPAPSIFTTERVRKAKALSDRLDAQIKAAFEGEEILRDAMMKDLKAIPEQKDRAIRSRLIGDYQAKYRKDYQRILTKAKVDLGGYARDMGGIFPMATVSVVDGTHLVGREAALPAPPPPPPASSPPQTSPAPARDPLLNVGRHAPGISAFGPLREEERTCDGRNVASGRVMVSESSFSGIQIGCRSAASRSTVLDTYVQSENGRDSTIATWASISVSASGWAEAVGVAGSSNAGMQSELYVGAGEGYVRNGQRRLISILVFAPLLWAAEDVRPDVSFGIALDRYGLPLNLGNGDMHYTIRTSASSGGMGGGAAGAKIVVSDYAYERRWPD